MIFIKTVQLSVKRAPFEDKILTKISLKVPSYDPTLRIRFLVSKIGSRRSDSPISRFRFCGENVRRSFVVCSHDPF